MINVKIDISKEFDEFKNLCNMSRLKPMVEKVVEERTAQLMNDYKETILSGGKYAGIVWTPLSETTVRLKGFSGIWFETTFLAQSMFSLINKTSTGWNIEVHTASFTSQGDNVAKLLDEGTSKMPERPLFKPVWDKLKHESQFTEHTMKKLKKYFNQTGII